MSETPPQATCGRSAKPRRRAGGSAALALVGSCLLMMVGCATPEAYKKAESAAAVKDWDAAVAYYQTAYSDHPDRLEYDMKLQRAKVNAGRQHRTTARRFSDAGDLVNAVREYQLAVQLNPSDQIAQAELREAATAVAVAEAAKPTMTPLERTVREAQRTVLELPRLEPKVDTISLWYPSASIKAIWRALAQVGGLNVVFDQDVQDRQTSFELDEEMPFEQVLTLLSRVHGQFVKAISAETFIVVPDSADKRALYEDEVMRTFFLSNAQVQEVAALLRSVLDSNSITENTSTNSITVRDRPDVMELAARLISTADKSPGEILLQIEVMEVDRRTLREYGVSLSSYEVTQSLAQGPAGISLFNLRSVDATKWFFTIPSVRYKLFKETGDFKLVADPQLRVLEGQQASLLIGQEVPIVITQFSPSQFVGGQIVPIQSTEYRNVGIELTVGARVHHNGEVTLTIDFEISSISAQIGVQGLPIFITRQVRSTTRVRDGETAVLAGLLRDDERMGVVGIPGLSDIPIIGKLFSSTRMEIEQVDVILTMTPHVLRMANIEEADVEMVYLGREIGIGEGVLVRADTETRIFPTTEIVTREPLGETAEALDRTAAAVPAGPALTLVGPDEEVNVGDTFEIEVRLDQIEGLMSAGVGLSFDDRRLQFIDGFEGSFFATDGAETVFEARAISSNSVALAVTRIGNATPAAGAGPVARLTFRAIAPGEAAVRFNTVTLRKPDGQPLAVIFRPVRVRINR